LSAAGSGGGPSLDDAGYLEYSLVIGIGEVAAALARPTDCQYARSSSVLTLLF
jgi:hypothetical protein